MAMFQKKGISAEDMLASILQIGKSSTDARDANFSVYDKYATETSVDDEEEEEYNGKGHQQQLREQDEEKNIEEDETESPSARFAKRILNLNNNGGFRGQQRVPEQQKTPVAVNATATNVSNNTASRFGRSNSRPLDFEGASPPKERGSLDESNSTATPNTAGGKVYVPLKSGDEEGSTESDLQQVSKRKVLQRTSSFSGMIGVRIPFARNTSNSSLGGSSGPNSPDKLSSEERPVSEEREEEEKETDADGYHYAFRNETVKFKNVSAIWDPDAKKGNTPSSPTRPSVIEVQRRYKPLDLPKDELQVDGIITKEVTKKSQPVSTQSNEPSVDHSETFSNNMFLNLTKGGARASQNLEGFDVSSFGRTSSNDISDDKSGDEGLSEILKMRKKIMEKKRQKEAEASK